MKLFLTCVLIMVSLASARETDVSKVYICVSGSAEVYHSTTECRGIKQCTHEVRAVTVEEAVHQFGRRACKICY